eukprot:TRINITY_DN158229_c0_g1_i1.p1 TRINITY_DN158229_c0_g1~~TRINITY_DN158229_c0_g1_i1.p1  ORF type:complete len:117 (+),score=8.86 TRINITY_DN158229_c0_g1_i1:97-447(+)
METLWRAIGFITKGAGPSFWKSQWKAKAGWNGCRLFEATQSALSREVEIFWRKAGYWSPVSWTHSPSKFWFLLALPSAYFAANGFGIWSSFQARYAAELQGSAYGQGGVYVLPPQK